LSGGFVKDFDMSTDRKCDVLVVAAHPPELEGLKELLGASLDGEVGALRVATDAVGIGLVSAAVGTSIAIASHAPRCVVLVGTCGAYPRRGADLAVGDVVVAHRVHLASTAAIEARGGFPAPMIVAAEADSALSHAIGAEGARPAGVATTLAITTDDDLANRVGDSLGCETEHLEAFAVASACARARVPFAMAFGVANRVGSRAREEWLRHHLAAGRAATDVVAAWLRRGAPGMGPRS
jgi:nucleoside phosphorylase